VESENAILQLQCLTRRLAGNFGAGKSRSLAGRKAAPAGITGLGD